MSFSFSDTQIQALDAFKNGKSFLLSGSAGTGKSRLILEFKEISNNNNNNSGDDGESKNIAICATTGLAAVQIGGRTLDSFMHIYPQDCNTNMELLITTKMKNRNWVKTLKDLDILLIDEVSMLTPRKFLQCDSLLKAVRANEKPFGGLQVVLIGDFFQLPPISSSASSADENATFIFELESFYALLDEVIDLKEVHRQKDAEFVSLLMRMRVGNLSENDKEVLHSRVNATLKDDGIKPTSLFAQNVDVDQMNFLELEKLRTTKHVFTMRNGCKKSNGGPKLNANQAFDVQNLQKLQDTLIKEVNLPQSLELRIGAQVMLVHNLDVSGGLVNGSRGVVIGFAQTSKDNLDRDFDPEPLGANKKEGPDRNLYYPDDPLPIVKFASFTPGGKQRAIEIPFVRWEKTEKKIGEAWITALPIKLAWSSTIHKCQGSSLDRVEAAIDKTVFAYGQAYVALSRVTSLEGLTLRSFDSSVVRAHPSVIEFYRSSFKDVKAQKCASFAEKIKKCKPSKRARSSTIEDSVFAPVVLNAEQVMASEARMLEIFAQQRLQDQDEDVDEDEF